MIEGFAVDATGLVHVAELRSGRTLCGAVVQAARSAAPAGTCGSCVAETLLSRTRRAARVPHRPSLGPAARAGADGIVSCGVLEAAFPAPAADMCADLWTSSGPNIRS
ncbi:hypothetical protein ABZ805_27295 [Saccharopolyspora sp. NPDC047091]|uniref:hypothetical protein n=1 Tax=Saccharopolyspora sp. NPDC047091 TaxID=3155924 RepID=UPI0033FEDBD8